MIIDSTLADLYGVTTRRLNEQVRRNRHGFPDDFLFELDAVEFANFPVATIGGSVADGMSEAEILEAYPDLTADDIHKALRFAAQAVRERTLPLTS